MIHVIFTRLQFLGSFSDLAFYIQSCLIKDADLGSLNQQR